MTDLAGRSPLGPKPAKPPKKLRSRIPAQSAKRRAYLASQAFAKGLAHMARVKAMNCVCCDAPGPSDAHHVTGDDMPRNDMRVIPLCFWCHRGPCGYHADKAAWVARYGPDVGFLERVTALLGRGTRFTSAFP